MFFFKIIEDNTLPPLPQPTLVIFLSLLYLLSNVKDKSHVTFGGDNLQVKNEIVSCFFLIFYKGYQPAHLFLFFFYLIRLKYS